MTLPSIFMLLFSRRPICFDCRTTFFSVVLMFFSRPRKGNNNVKILYIVSRNYVRVNFSNKITPSHKHFTLFHVGHNLRAHYRSTSVQSKNVSNKWVFFSLSLHHVCYLNYRIFFGLGENTFSARTLNVKAEHSQWSYFDPFSFSWMRNQVFYVQVNFQLASAHVFAFISYFVNTSRYFDPITPCYVQISHKSDLKVNVALKSLVALHTICGKLEASLQHSLHHWYKF
ncbi:hypothetical protein BpHYR1_021948 [Brachionus plicatilis]|uniref:Uncharacterized protein n=1 Tax=Brachionus plicatilis TaxID=10195 RepID=A0A3M7PZ30_BRAPC|nr:hypothetical protein BpHYR1_021948 [Brachionus plicatilis]